MLDRIKSAFRRLFDWIDGDPLKAACVILAGLVVVLCVALLVTCSSAKAATLDGTFTLPTQYADGVPPNNTGATPLPQSSIKHIQVEVGTCTGTPGSFGTKEGEQLVVPPVTTWIVTVPRTFGGFCARARTVTVLGTIGDYIPVPAFRTIPEPKPLPPGAFVIATIAYELRTDPSTGERYVRAVGDVPIGTACLGLAPQYGFDLFEVNRDDVHLDKGVKRDATLVAQCAAT